MEPEDDKKWIWYRSPTLIAGSAIVLVALSILGWLEYRKWREEQRAEVWMELYQMCRKGYEGQPVRDPQLNTLAEECAKICLDANASDYLARLTCSTRFVRANRGR